MRVEARGLCRRFGRVEILRDLTFQVAPGERVALIGPNGSGKSTLIRILVGLLDYRGEIEIDGRAAGPDALEIARRTGYVPQIAPSFAVPVGELVRALTRLRGVHGGAVHALCARLGLELEPLEKTPFRSLSGGMKQKLLIALALAHRPRLLILDEPTGSLDAEGRERLFELLGGIEPDTTVLLCSHRLDEVRRLVERVLVLDEGRLAFDGPLASFLTPGAVEPDPASPVTVRAADA